MDRITDDPNDPDVEPRIRDLQVTVWQVYQDLHSHLGSAEKVLEKCAELDQQDVAAVDAYVADIIRSRNRDDMTGRPLLPKAELRHGHCYKGRCRNATIARWNAEENCFYHWRVKFDRVFIQTIRYPTDEHEPWWDIFFVVEELANPKFEIPFDAEAAFTGNPDDLIEFNEEMWTRLSGFLTRKRRKIE